MKRISTFFLTLILFACCNTSWAQQRYLSPIFSNVTIDTGIVYSHNIDMLNKIYIGSGPGVDRNLAMDMYTPTGDTATARPVIIYLHTGSFLPINIGSTFVNQQATGSRLDSSAVEMCKDFAKRGYVAVAIDYRLGWNPLSSDQNVRTGTLLRAVYRALQDTRACVRFFKNNAANGGNTYKIDTSRIVVVGQGSGGYVALATACLNSQAGTNIAKFLDLSKSPPASYVNADSLGDIYGFGGVTDTSNANSGCIPNYVGISSKVAAVVNIGGALGDSSWLQAGNPPIIAIHVPGDPFAPYQDGAVIVPVTNQFVVNVRGSFNLMEQANALGNNSYNLRYYNDPYTVRANSVNQGVKGLFPFVRPAGESAPWEWWDQNAIPSAINNSALAGDPMMSKTFALHYIDSMQGFINPRLVVALNLPGQENFPTGIDEVVSSVDLSIFPNPAYSSFEVQVKNSKYEIQSINLFDVTGRLVKTEQVNNAGMYTLNRNGICAGVYFVNIRFVTGEQANTRIIFE